MKIAVLVKQVPGSESSLPINASNNWVDESSITYVMNPPDNFALEEALIIKEKIGSGLNKQIAILVIRTKTDNAGTSRFTLRS